MSDTDAFSDVDIFSKTLDGEAGNQGYDGQCAVADVIMRRVSLKWQGETTARGVCLHPKQFSCWLPGKDRDRIMKSTNNQCLNIAGLAMRGFLSDNTNGATHYVDDSIAAPYWAKGYTPCATMGRLIFYDLSKPLHAET